MAKLYAVVFEAQREQISELCWGKGCGKGVVGALYADGFSFVCCREENCPHAERTMDEPCGMRGDSVTGDDDVYLRKLKEKEDSDVKHVDVETERK